METKPAMHPYADARLAVLLATILWATGVALAAAGGSLSRLPTAVIAALVVATIAVAVSAVRWDARIREWLGGVDPRVFTALNAWRLPAGLALLAAGSQGLLPASFALTAGWGDIAVGVAAIALVAAKAGPRAHLAFQFLGLADFVVAVGTGLTHTVLGTPLMENVVALPIAFIPLVGVPLTAAVHVAAIASLLKAPADRPPVASALAAPRASR